MAQRRIVAVSLAALIAVVLTCGLAALAVVGHLPAGPASAVVVTAYDAGGSRRVESSGADRSLAALDTASLPATAAVAAPTVTAPDTTLPPAPPAQPPAWGPDSLGPALPPPVLVAPTTPPVVPVAPPSSWSLDENGITITATISPALPRAGDTVTISYTTAAEGDFCCWSHVLVDGAVVDKHLFPPGDGCPMASEGSWTTSVVVTVPGPFTFQVQGNSWENLCVGPPVYFNANLFATFEVRPAA